MCVSVFVSVSENLSVVGGGRGGGSVSAAGPRARPDPGFKPLRPASFSSFFSYGSVSVAGLRHV